MGCKARFLSFGDGFIPSSGKAAGCRSDSTLSSHHRAFALPKPDQPAAFIRSGNLSPGSGKQQSWDTVPLQDAGDGTPRPCGACGSGDHPLPTGRCPVWRRGCAVRLQHKASPRQFAPPCSKCPPSPSVLPLCLWWGVGGFGVCGTGPAGEGRHGAEVTLCTFVFCCSQDALSEPIKCMKGPGSKLTPSQSHSHCKQQQDVNAEFLHF